MLKKKYSQSRGRDNANIKAHMDQGESDLDSDSVIPMSTTDYELEIIYNVVYGHRLFKSHEMYSRVAS